MMEIRKDANVSGGGAVSGEDLERINALAKSALKAEEVYTFAVRLCDNEIDREWERFPGETLEALAGLFVGKSGIFDHDWSAKGQVARIYKTEVVSEDGKLTKAGDGLRYLKGWAYMVRTEDNAGLIAEIEGGIKKEVSVGCAVEKAVCSVCGEELGSCRHVKGRTYNGKLCWGELLGAKDAYEWSFVAVPAQKDAGVLKGMKVTLKELSERYPELAGELSELEREAQVGRRYVAGLRGEVLRLAAMSWGGVEPALLRGMIEKLDHEELTALRGALGRRVKEEWPGGSQLMGSETRREGAEDGAFLV